VASVIVEDVPHPVRRARSRFYVGSALLITAIVSYAVSLLVWYLPVLLGMGYDLVARRRIHPVYWIGVAAMTLALARIPLAQSEVWRRVGRALLTPLL